MANTRDLAYPDGGHQVGIVSAGAWDAYELVGFNKQKAGANANVAGIALLPSEAAGDYVTICATGIYPVKAGSNASTVNLTPGTKVKSDATGKAIAATAATDIVFGIVWCDSPTATAADQLVLVLISREGREAAT